MLAVKHFVTFPISDDQKGPCHKALQAVSMLALGLFVPKCEDDGYYSPQQHHGSTGQSWCVTTEGKEIGRTRTSPGQPPVDCIKGTSVFRREGFMEGTLLVETETGRQGDREAGRQGGREAGRQGGREAGRQGGREAGRQGGREAGRQGGREAGRQGGREAGRQGGREAGRQGGREAGRQGGREAGRQGDRETERQRDRETERDIPTFGDRTKFKHNGSQISGFSRATLCHKKRFCWTYSHRRAAVTSTSSYLTGCTLQRSGGCFQSVFITISVYLIPLRRSPNPIHLKGRPYFKHEEWWRCYTPSLVTGPQTNNRVFIMYIFHLNGWHAYQLQLTWLCVLYAAWACRTSHSIFLLFLRDCLGSNLCSHKKLILSVEQSENNQESQKIYLNNISDIRCMCQ